MGVPIPAKTHPWRRVATWGTDLPTPGIMGGCTSHDQGGNSWQRACSATHEQHVRQVDVLYKHRRSTCMRDRDLCRNDSCISHGLKNIQSSAPLRGAPLCVCSNGEIDVQGLMQHRSLSRMHVLRLCFLQHIYLSHMLLTLLTCCRNTIAASCSPPPATYHAFPPLLLCQK